MIVLTSNSEGDQQNDGPSSFRTPWNRVLLSG